MVLLHLVSYSWLGAPGFRSPSEAWRSSFYLCGRVSWWYWSGMTGSVPNPNYCGWTWCGLYIVNIASCWQWDRVGVLTDIGRTVSNNSPCWTWNYGKTIKIPVWESGKLISRALVMVRYIVLSLLSGSIFISSLLPAGGSGGIRKGIQRRGYPWFWELLVTHCINQQILIRLPCQLSCCVYCWPVWWHMEIWIVPRHLDILTWRSGAFYVFAPVNP